MRTSPPAEPVGGRGHLEVCEQRPQLIDDPADGPVVELQDYAATVVGGAAAVHVPGGGVRRPRSRREPGYGGNRA